MNKLSAKITLALLAVLPFGVKNVAAEPPVHLLTKGLTSDMVRKMWGPPEDVQEREASRMVIWDYPRGATVTLKENRVTDFTMPKGAVPIVEPAPKPAVENVAKLQDPEASLTRDLVREIAAEIPSGPDVPGSTAVEVVNEPPSVVNVPPPQPPIQQVQPGQFQAMPNPPSRGAFYIPEEEDE